MWSPPCEAGTTPLRIARTHEPEGATAVPFIAPSEIQNTKLSAALRGYDREETDTLLTQIKASYERVWEEREELRAEVMRLQAQARENGQLRAELERIEPELEELKESISCCATHSSRPSGRPRSSSKTRSPRLS